MMDTRYNLRSNKSECHILVQLQLTRDDEFLASLASSSGQDFDSEQSNSSMSDIDTSALFIILIKIFPARVLRLVVLQTKENILD